MVSRNTAQIEMAKASVTTGRPYFNLNRMHSSGVGKWLSRDKDIK